MRLWGYTAAADRRELISLRNQGQFSKLINLGGEPSIYSVDGGGTVTLKMQIL
jgi:hypothetical protein